MRSWTYLKEVMDWGGLYYEDDIRIWKGTRETKASYDLLRNFRHSNVIDMLNFYSDEEDVEEKGCIVIPNVTDSTFLAWFEGGGRNLLFNDKNQMTPVFRNMVIDLCDVSESLFNKQVHVKSLSKNNMYIKGTLHDSRLLVLLTQVEMFKNLTPPPPSERNKFVKDLVDWCTTECHVELDFLSRCFASFIVSEKFSLEKLKNYPDVWSNKVKGNYLLLLLSKVTHTHARRYVKKANIQWPTKLPRAEDKRPKKGKDPKRKLKLEDLPDLLATIVNHHENQTSPEECKTAAEGEESKTAAEGEESMTAAEGEENRTTAEGEENRTTAEGEENRTTAEGEESRKKKYNLDDPFDYIRILRHTKKHFNQLADAIKEMLGGEEGFIKQIEQWTPHIWTSLYEISGELKEDIKGKKRKVEWTN